MKGDYFVYTGNSYPHKNLQRLIEAIVLLNSNRVKKVKLKISSSRSIFTERLEKIIKDKKAEKYVEFLGYVTDSEISKLYKDSISFVFSTLSEGFGLPPKEAIESGTFAIISDIPVLKEVYKDSVIYFNPLDVKSIVGAMKVVLNMTESERQKKIKYAQDFLKCYSWETMAEETVKIYESVV